MNMDNDMLMAKDPPKGWVNLAVGEPGLLRERLLPLLSVPPTPLGSPYPSPRGNEALREELLKYSNGSNPHPKRYVVVTNGSKQGLLAAYWAYYNESKSTFCHPRPAWPSHRTLASLAGFTRFTSFCDPEARAETLVVNTSPNNPDGAISTRECDIWDAAYAHFIYGFKWSSMVPQHETAVFSAAKIFGLSGERIGWVTTSNIRIAEYVSRYVEATTSGVSRVAQDRLLNLMLQTLQPSSNAECADAYRAVRDQIERNREDLARVLGGRPENTGSGMFAWIPLDAAGEIAGHFARAKVAVLPGAACGLSNFIRVNLGGPEAEFQEALLRLVATQRKGQ